MTVQFASKDRPMIIVYFCRLLSTTVHFSSVTILPRGHIYWTVHFQTVQFGSDSYGKSNTGSRIPTVKLKIPEKSRIQKFCYIQVIVFDLSYLPVAAVGT